jgi:aquaporin Z
VTGAAGARVTGLPASAVRSALRAHWPEYVAEAACLGLFLLSAVLFTVLLEWPGSPARAALPDAFGRRALMGAAMGATAMALVYSRLGQRSGAHMNPAFTLAFLRLGKIEPADALFYVLAQLAGGVGGVLAAAAVLAALGAPGAIADPHVRYAVTVPGEAGALVAFGAEVAIAFGMMSLVLVLANHARVARATGVLVGLLVAAYIAFEAPLSGMSMNPARTLGSALPARVFDALWIYLSAPLVGMLAAAEIVPRTGLVREVMCAKLNHHTRLRCIFRCGWRSE